MTKDLTASSFMIAAWTGSLMAVFPPKVGSLHNSVVGDLLFANPIAWMAPGKFFLPFSIDSIPPKSSYVASESACFFLSDIRRHVSNGHLIISDPGVEDYLS